MDAKLERAKALYVEAATAGEQQALKIAKQYAYNWSLKAMKHDPAKKERVARNHAQSVAWAEKMLEAARSKHAQIFDDTINAEEESCSSQS